MCIQEVYNIPNTRNVITAGLEVCTFLTQTAEFAKKIVIIFNFLVQEDIFSVWSRLSLHMPGRIPAIPVLVNVHWQDLKTSVQAIQSIQNKIKLSMSHFVNIVYVYVTKCKHLWMHTKPIKQYVKPGYRLF